MSNKKLKHSLRLANDVLQKATPSDLPDLNRLVGEYELREIRDIRVGDVIVQFGVRNTVLEIIPPKRFPLLPSSRKWKLLIRTEMGTVARWKNLVSGDQFRVLYDDS